MRTAWLGGTFAFASAGFSLWIAAVEVSRRGWWPEFVLPSGFAAFQAVSGWMLFRRSRRLRRTIRSRSGRCAACGYDLTGNASGVCPECGTAVTPKDPVGAGP